MRILINGSFAQSLLNFRGDLIRELLKIGHEVHVTAPDISDSIRAELEALGAYVHEIELERTGFGVVSDIGYLFQLRGIISKFKIDHVINYTIKPNIYGSLAAASKGTASTSMMTGLGYAFYKSTGVKHKIVGIISRVLYRMATTANKFVIFQNPDDRNEFLAAGCLGNSAKIRMMNGSGVNMQHFARPLLPEKPVFLMIARLLISKGVREYAAAAQQVMAEHKEAEFLLAGFIDEGPDSITSKELEKWQSAGIKYLGPLDDIRDAMARASVYVLPSYREGTPRTVLEAMAMGRPIITTDAPGCRETVAHNQTGLLVPPKDADSLAKAMLLLAGDRALREEMGDASYRYCRQQFDVHKVNAKLLSDIGLSAP